MRRDRMTELVPGNRDLVALRVLDRDRESGLDIAHRFADVLPREALAPVLERIQEGERKGLLDFGRRVSVGDASELLAALRCVQRRVVLLLVEVKRCDVLAVVA